MVNQKAPRVWCEARWLGSEDSLDFHAFWTEAHGIHIAGWLIGLCGITDLDVVQASVLKCTKDIDTGGSRFHESSAGWV